MASITPVGTIGAPKVPDPGQIGPYAVGHVAFMLYDPSRPCDVGARPIPVEVFYPVDPQAISASTPEAIYPLDPINGVWPETVSSEWEAFGIDPAFEEPPASVKKPFPLVLLSPGWGGPVWVHLYQGTRLASHGFVVAIMYHYGDAWFPNEQFDHIAVACLNRPLDVSFILTDLLAKNASQSGVLSGLIDPELVAASGWSLGGFASMALAAGVDNIGYNMESELLPEEPPCPPETYVPIPADPRIKAIVPLDGSNQCMQFYELARVTVPAMGIGQEWSMLLDWGDPWTSWQARQHAAFQGHPHYRVDVTGAWHQSFSNVCEAMHVVFEKGLIDEETLEWWEGMVCAAPAPNSLVLPASTKYMIAFLKTNLCRVQGYQSMLTPGYVLKNEPLLEFFVTEKRNPNSIDDKWPGYYIYFPHQPGSEQAKAEMNPKTPMGIPHFGLKR
jgi:predicted dienelactone hydrolase